MNKSKQKLALFASIIGMSALLTAPAIANTDNSETMGEDKTAPMINQMNQETQSRTDKSSEETPTKNLFLL